MVSGHLLLPPKSRSRITLQVARLQNKGRWREGGGQNLTASYMTLASCSSGFSISAAKLAFPVSAYQAARLGGTEAQLPRLQGIVYRRQERPHRHGPQKGTQQSPHAACRQSRGQQRQVSLWHTKGGALPFVLSPGRKCSPGQFQDQHLSESAFQTQIWSPFQIWQTRPFGLARMKRIDKRRRDLHEFSACSCPVILCWTDEYSWLQVEALDLNVDSGIKYDPGVRSEFRKFKQAFK